MILQEVHRYIVRAFYQASACHATVFNFQGDLSSATCARKERAAHHGYQRPRNDTTTPSTPRQLLDWELGEQFQQQSVAGDIVAADNSEMWMKQEGSDEDFLISQPAEFARDLGQWPAEPAGTATRHQCSVIMSAGAISSLSQRKKRKAQNFESRVRSSDAAVGVNGGVECGRVELEEIYEGVDPPTGELVSTRCYYCCVV